MSELYSDTVAPITIDAPSREVIATISTSAPDRVGDIVEPYGLDYTAFMKTGSVLFNHSQNQPIARCINIRVMNDRVIAIAKFPEAGKSKRADEIYNLIQSHVINATSIGFLPTASTPIKNASGKVTGLHITKSELLEFSFVSVPANPQALIHQRSALRSLAPQNRTPIHDVDAGRKLKILLGMSRIDPTRVDIDAMVRGLSPEHAKRVREVYEIDLKIHLAKAKEEIDRLQRRVSARR